MLQTLKSILKKFFPLFFSLFLVLLLRIPNFFEPYWYGDEAIYLTVGTGLRNGLRLYTDIIDHKTPLIYYFAMTPTQFDFRVLNLGWMLVTTTFFYGIAKKVFQKTWPITLTMAIFVLLTTLPILEGNIPNGELFVMGFVLAGGYLFTKTRFFAQFLESSTHKKLPVFHLRESVLLYVSGFFIGLGILTKVPGLLDFGAFLIVNWFFFVNQLSLKTFFKSAKKLLPRILLNSVVFSFGVLTPILISILYFVSLGSGQDYLDYGLLYNIRYSGSWQPQFSSELIAKIFTLPGKTAVLGLFVVLLTILRKHTTPRFQFFTAWFGLAFFAALLSNRPYPHYLLQLVPSFALLCGYVFEKISLLNQPKKMKLFEWGILGLLVWTFFFTKNVLEFSTYPTLSYYERFIDLQTGKISKKDYDESFNWLVKENYEVTQFIQKAGITKMFIWGTNPMLYAQTQTIPTSRFTVSFHIKDFNDYDRTFRQIEREQPSLIIVMNEESTPFPQLEMYLQENYIQNTQYQTMTLYQKHAN